LFGNNIYALTNGLHDVYVNIIQKDANRSSQLQIEGFGVYSPFTFSGNVCFIKKDSSNNLYLNKIDTTNGYNLTTTDLNISSQTITGQPIVAGNSVYFLTDNIDNSASHLYGYNLTDSSLIEIDMIGPIASYSPTVLNSNIYYLTDDSSGTQLNAIDLSGNSLGNNWPKRLSGQTSSSSPLKTSDNIYFISSDISNNSYITNINNFPYLTEPSIDIKIQNMASGTSVSDLSGNCVVTFPNLYQPSTTPIIVATISDGTFALISITSQSTTGFTVSAQTVNGGPASPAINWIAMNPSS
jgi:hypothetical protein